MTKLGQSPPKELKGAYDPADYDPPKEQRRYFRHHQSADLGYLVVRGGKDHIRLDRPFDPSTILYREGEWVPEVHAEPLSKAQATIIAYAADRILCQSLGLIDLARKEWHQLTAADRVKWLGNGPPGPPPRQELYRSIMKTLEPHTRPEKS